jgi:hypothetical protein
MKAVKGPQRTSTRIPSTPRPLKVDPSASTLRERKDVFQVSAFTLKVQMPL